MGDTNNEELVALREKVRRLEATVTGLEEEVRMKDGQLVKNDIELRAWDVMMHQFQEQLRVIPDLREQLAASNAERDGLRLQVVQQLSEEARSQVQSAVHEAVVIQVGEEVPVNVHVNLQVRVFAPWAREEYHEEDVPSPDQAPNAATAQPDDRAADASDLGEARDNPI